MLIVQKYGGSSLKDPERLRHVAELCRARREKDELVVVVSAMGGTTDSLTGRIHDVAVRRLSVHGDLDPVMEIRGNDPGHATSNVVLEGVTINGAPLDPAIIRRNDNVSGLEIV